MPDLFNREIFGWSIKQRMTAEIVTNALMMVWFRSVRVHRNVKGGIVRYGPMARCRRLAGQGRSLQKRFRRQCAEQIGEVSPGGPR